MKAGKKRTKPTVSENRGSYRIPLGKVIAHVELGGESEALAVCVSDISRTGARLLIPLEIKLPSCIKISLDQIMTVEARIVWRTRSHVGVNFVKDL